MLTDNSKEKILSRLEAAAIERWGQEVTKSIEEAIKLAVEEIYAVTEFKVRHANEPHVYLDIIKDSRKSAVSYSEV